MKGQNLFIIILVLLLIGGAVFFFSNKQRGSVQKEEAAQDQQEDKLEGSDEKEDKEGSEPSEGQEDSNEVEEIEVDGSSFKFEPNTITVKKGQKTRIVFSNIDGMHDFNVKELGIATKVIKTGEKDTVEFTPDKTGTFEYYCSVGQHRANGMTGTMVVE